MFFLCGPIYILSFSQRPSILKFYKHCLICNTGYIYIPVYIYIPYRYIYATLPHNKYISIYRIYTRVLYLEVYNIYIRYIYIYIQQKKDHVSDSTAFAYLANRQRHGERICISSLKKDLKMGWQRASRLVTQFCEDPMQFEGLINGGTEEVCKFLRIYKQ